MPGMKVTVDAAMRARDVSRPRPDHDAAAEAAIADLPALRKTPGTHVAPVPAPARGPQPPRPVPGDQPLPRYRPGPPAPGPGGEAVTREKERPAPPPHPAVAPPPGPPPLPSLLPNADAGHPGPGREPGAPQTEKPPAAGAEHDPHGAPAAARPARRKRIRHRRSHGR